MPNSMQIDMKLLSVEKLVTLLIQTPVEAPRAIGAGMFEEGNSIMREAKEQIPFRFGVAKGSGRVFSPREAGGQTIVELGFGGAASAYVEVLHENRLNRVFKNGKKSKYLEDPVREAETGMEERLARRVRAVIKRNAQ